MTAARRLRSMLVVVAVGLVTTTGCGDDRSASESGSSSVTQRRAECLREHSVEPRWQPAVRAMCSELANHGGVSVAVAVAEGDEVIWSYALGPRCRGRPEPLRPTTTLRVGSVTKLVTAAVALRVAEAHGVDLDDDTSSLVPGVSLTLRSLLQHTSGLRDPEAVAMLGAGEAWPALLAGHRVAPGRHHYANANYLVLGRWIERTEGRSLEAIVADDPELSAVRERLLFRPEQASEPGCGHHRGLLGWWPIPLRTERPLPAYTRPAGGGLASAEQLARLPAALARTNTLEAMVIAPVPTSTPEMSQGLGVRMLDIDGEVALVHAGRTEAHWAELQWLPSTGVSVAVVASTPQPFRATTLAAFTAAAGLELEP